jgi:hypothetical protein
MKGLHSCNKTGPPAVSAGHAGVYSKLLVVLLKAFGANPQGDFRMLPINAACTFQMSFVKLPKTIK